MTFDYVSVSFSTVLLVALFSTRAVVFLLALVEFLGAPFLKWTFKSLNYVSEIVELTQRCQIHVLLRI